MNFKSPHSGPLVRKVLKSKSEAMGHEKHKAGISRKPLFGIREVQQQHLSILGSLKERSNRGGKRTCELLNTEKRAKD